MFSRKQLNGERLEERRCLTSIGFASHNIDDPTPPLRNVIAADIDGDGDQDLIGGDIIWRENLDGRGEFGEGKVVSTQSFLVSQLLATDVEGDGDLDIVSASYHAGELAWFENRDGLGRFGPKQLIANYRGPSSEILAGDLDGDGRIELLHSKPDFDNNVTVYRYSDDNRAVDSFYELDLDAHAIELNDLDNDNDLDLIVASAGGINLIENLGDGNFSAEPQRLIEDSRKFAIGDVDNNGRKDIIVVDLQLHRFEATVRPLEFIEVQTFGSDEIVGLFLLRPPQLGDIDGDGDFDVGLAVSSFEYTGFHWYELGADQTYRDRTGTDGPATLANIDGEPGDEVISATAWRSFDPALNDLGDEHRLHEPQTGGISWIGTADLDGDNDLDIVTASFMQDCPDFGPCVTTIAWSENLDGRGTFGVRQLIDQSNKLDAVRFAELVDVDNDFDVDLVIESQWYENVDGAGTFGPAIPSEGRYPIAAMLDLDGDGDLDAILASYLGFTHGLERIFWQENTDGRGTFSDSPFPVIRSPDEFEQIAFIDWDGDGDLDILASVSPVNQGASNQVIWFERNDDSVTFEDAAVIVTSDSHVSNITVATFIVGDYDGDGDRDLVQGFWNRNESHLFWRQNLDPQVGFGKIQTIGDEAIFDLWSVDLDSDGDLDVVSKSSSSGTHAWYENLDGQGSFSGRLVLPINSPEFAYGDLDGDGDLDLVSEGRQNGILWHEQRIVGDANGDDRFTSADLVQVMQAGLYDDNVSNSATFATGDWNHDGYFNSSDLVLAFQAGHYSAATISKANQITAAVDQIFAAEDSATTNVQSFCGLKGSPCSFKLFFAR